MVRLHWLCHGSASRYGCHQKRLVRRDTRMPNGPLLEARGVSKRFDEPFVLHHIDLAVEPGELTAIIGPNGAGKSTLINVLSGRYGPTDGELLWQGRRYTGA